MRKSLIALFLSAIVIAILYFFLCSYYPTGDGKIFEHSVKDNGITKLMEATMKSGVFWIVEDKLLAFPFGTPD